MSMRIEFCGLPGAGKSTLYAAFMEEARRIDSRFLPRNTALDVCMKRRDDGLIKNLLKCFPATIWKRFMGIENALSELQHFASARPGLIAHACRILVDHGVAESGRQCVLSTLFRTCIEFDLTSRYLRDNEVLVMDEGFVHRVFTLYGYLPDVVSESEIQQFLYHLPLPDIVIHVKADPAICLERLAKRPEPRFMLARLDTDGQARQLALGDKRLLTAVSLLAQRGVHVETFDTDAAMDVTLDKIRISARSILEDLR